MVAKLSRPVRGRIIGAVLTYVLIALSIVTILARPNILLLWLIVGLILYSYNFVFLLIPTSTTQKVKIKDRVDLGAQKRDLREIANHLIRKKKGLAIEMGLTVFLGGMVPMALSFTVIFGIGLFFALQFGVLSHAIDPSAAFAIVTQVVFILSFYLLLIFFEPHSQGMTRIAKHFSTRFKRARASGKMSMAAVVGLIIVVATVSALLFFGAVVLPGSTLVQLIVDPMVPHGLGFFDLAFVIGAEAIIMRHFQGIYSRKMARDTLCKRLRTLREDVLAMIGGFPSKDQADSEYWDEKVERIRSLYCNLAIYDINEHSFFGYAPVYMVAPRIRYAMDDRILRSATFHDPEEMEEMTRLLPSALFD